MQFTTKKNITVACSSPAHNSLTAEHFSADYWRRNHQLAGTSRGRRTTWFVRRDAKPWVLRHYWRGGLMAKLSADWYFFSGIHYTRPVAELRLLEEMYQLGLPVPKPIAAKVEKVGLWWYRGDILTEQIEDAKDLHALLSETKMQAWLWRRLGEQIARFHNLGVCHADLNIRNILLADGRFHLIDFDRGEIRTPKKYWQRANISRLRRSFDKERAKLAALNFSEDNWRDFLQGYQTAVK